MSNARLLAVGQMLCGSLLAPAQQTFLVHLDSVQFEKQGYAHSVKEVADGYLVFGLERINSAYPAHLFVHKLDSLGAPQFQNEYLVGDPRTQHIGPNDPVISLDSSGFALATTFWWPGLEYSVGFLCFDENGDTLSMVESLSDVLPDTTNILLHQTRSVIAGGFVLCGGYYDGVAGRAYLARTNALGDTLWTRTYGPDSQSNDAYGVAEYFDGGFLLTGRGGATSYDKNFLIRTDSMGNQIWRRQFGGYGISPPSVRSTLDSNIVTWCDHKLSGGSNYWGQYMLTKWNAAGLVLWQKKIALSYVPVAGDLEVLPDGGFICTGKYNANAVILNRFSATGDSLWSRVFEVFDFYHYTYDVELTNDGGFVFCGTVRQDTTGPTPNLQTMFVIKTDSFGCVVPGCQSVGVQEYELGLQEHLLIAPNPAHDRIGLSLQLPEGYAIEGAVHAVLLDATGRQVAEQEVERNGNVLSSTLHLAPSTPAGLYYLHVKDRGKWLAGGKVVVE